MIEEVKEKEKVEIIEETEETPVFENYKQKQNYYKNKAKNYKVFFAQPGAAELFANGQSGTIKRQKGRTYRKNKIVGEM